MEIINTEKALEQLIKLSAHKTEHINENLLEHLRATHDLLSEWDNPTSICMAGLYHAVYGTDGFPTQLVPLNNRRDISSIIGTDAEELVYFYGACDRQYTYHHLINSPTLSYRDRFTDQKRIPSQVQFSAFCELTLANELQIVMANSDLLEQYHEFYVTLFTKIEGFVSKAAYRTYEDVFN